MDLYEACENGNEERAVELLLHGQDWVSSSARRGSVLGRLPQTADTRLQAVRHDRSVDLSAGAAASAVTMLQARGTAGRTPLLAACLGVQVGIVRLLLGEPCTVFFTGRSLAEAQELLAPLARGQRRRAAAAAFDAVATRELSLFDVTLATRDDEQQPVPMAVVQLPRDHVVAVRDLLEGRLHVDDFGNTPLQCASCFGCGSSERHVDDCLEMTRLLLAHGDQPNLPKRANQWTPLHWSAFNGNHEQAAVLLDPSRHLDTQQPIAKTQISVPLMVTDANLFPVDVAGRRGLVLVKEMAALRKSLVESQENSEQRAYARWRLRLDHAQVLKLFAREFVEHAGDLRAYVAEMNARLPTELLRVHQSQPVKRFTVADAVRYGQHLLYWVGCFGLVDELRALLRLKMKARFTGNDGEVQGAEAVTLQPLYPCSCEEGMRQSVLHAVAAHGQREIVALLLQEILDAHYCSPPLGSSPFSPQSPRVSRKNVVVPTADESSREADDESRIDVLQLVARGWRNHRNETPLFLAALFLRQGVVETLVRFLSAESLAWELAHCNVEGSFVRHVASHAAKLAMGVSSAGALVSGEYVLLLDGVSKRPFKESLIETLREDSATAPSLVVLRAGTRETRAPRLLARWIPSKQTDYLIVGVTNDVLTRHAEELQLKVKHRGSSVRSKFVAAASERFEPLRSLQRQQVVLDVIHKNVDVETHVRRGNVAAMFPLHDASGCKTILQHWVRTDSGARVFQPFWGNSLHQFLRERRAHPYEMLWPLLTYFGEKHAFYYAFMTFYTAWLLLIALPGTLCQVLWFAYGLRFVTPLFAIVVSIWATLLVERWKRKRSEILRNFGRFTRNRSERAPAFYGDFQVHALDDAGEVETTFPKAVQLARIYCGVPLLLAVGLTAVVIFVGVKMSLVSEQLVERMFPDLPIVLVPYVIPLLNAVSMLALDNVYTRVALALTRWENHRTVWQYESMLATKLFWFKFLNAFLSLFWVAFVDRDAATLRKQLVIVMGVRQLWYMAVRNVLPLLRVQRRWAAAGFRFRSSVTPTSRWAVMTAHEWYDAELGPEFVADGFKPAAHGLVPPMVVVQELMQPPDFLMGKQMEVILQFGYITMFVSVLPLAPLLALLVNVFNTRLDVVSCTQAKQRPPFESETEVTTFMSILEFMSFAAVAVNCAVLFFTTREDFESLLRLGTIDWSDSDAFYVSKLWVLLIIEHVVLGAKALLSLAIDDAASWVQNDEERADDEDKMRLLHETKASDEPVARPHTEQTTVADAPHERPSSIESVVDQLLADVADSNVSPHSPEALSRLETISRIVKGKLETALRERDAALERERKATEQLKQALAQTSSRPTATIHRAPSLSSAMLDETFAEPPPPEPQQAVPVSSQHPANLKNLRWCFFCFALTNAVVDCAKRCLTCRVFLCRQCDDLLHLDDFGAAEPAHFRVNVPRREHIDQHTELPQIHQNSQTNEVSVVHPQVLSPIEKELRHLLDVYIANDLPTGADAIDADEMFRRCVAIGPVAVRFLRNCERRRLLHASEGRSAV